MERSTIQRLGKTRKPLALSERLTISTSRRAGAFHRGLEWRSLIAAVGIELAQKRIEAKQSCHDHDAAVAVLDIGGMHHGVHQQALGIDQDMALLALDLLARIIARPVRDPPFSALLTLWLSMMAAVGEASLSTCSRHFT